MKKCSCCSTKKIFMTLKNGLCTQCYNDFLNCENNYKNLLEKATSPSSDLGELTNSITLLTQEFKKYDDISTSIKSSDCADLLNIANKFHKRNSSKPSFAKPSTFIENIPPESNTSDESNDINLESNSSVISNLLENNNLNENLDIKDTSELINDEISPIITPEKNLILETISQIPPTDPIKNISPELTKEAENLLHILSDNTLSIEDLTYYTFLLKNTYQSTLKEYNINEINDIKIEELIDSNLKHISLSTNCPVNKLYSYYNYVAFSIQTTGIKCISNDIIEIAAYKIRYGKIEDTFYTLVNPQKSISLSCEEKTKISNTMLSSAPSTREALANFLEFTDNLNLVSHNNNFNYGFLNYNYEKIYNKDLKMDSECSMKLFRTRFKHFYGEPTKRFDLPYCCEELLAKDTIKAINDIDSIASSNAFATYSLYEIIKNRYK